MSRRIVLNATYTYPVLGGQVRVHAVRGEAPAVVLSVELAGEVLATELTPAGARSLAAVLEAGALLVEDALVETDAT